jgi:predicted helicase
MSISGALKPTHKAIKAYREALDAYAGQRVTHEGATETAFSRLLTDAAKAHGWMLVPKLPIKRDGKSVIPDGTVRDAYNLHRGYWEAKDTDDDLAAEIKKKIAKGYPLTNTIFEDTTRAVLYQNGGEAFRADLTDPQALCDLLNAFFGHTEPDIEGFEQAVDEFKERVPELAQALAKIIKDAHDKDPKFQGAFEKFFTLCQTALNPNIRREAVDEMLIQHLLTERLIRTIFDKDDFTRQNVIAAEVETVIDALTERSFSRHKFLKGLDKFYVAIEHAAANLEDFREKQRFLNTVYERFFQGYSVKVADTHGIVYTPQEIVDFMCESVEEVLKKEFGKNLGDKDVQILDPCTGTGNFIVNLINRIPKKDLPRMYRQQLFANEVMLLPYYIAALNIEHAYFEKTANYESFEGLCFVDTLDLAEKRQATFEFLNEENTQRVERQRNAPITVIVGNPPYNMNQQNENDNNKNRKYRIVDDRIRATYAADSEATLNTKLYDAYVRFFRWATDRLNGRDGIVCFVSNNGFIDQIAFDGMRKHLAVDFDILYLLDLKGNVRKDSMRHGIPLGEKHTVFGLSAMVGVSVSILVRRRSKRKPRLLYSGVDWRATRQEKLALLTDAQSCSGVVWERLSPDPHNNWLAIENADKYSSFCALGNKEAKAGNTESTIFQRYSLGVSTNRDSVAFGFDRNKLLFQVEAFGDNYNSELDRFVRKGHGQDLDQFLDYSKLKWSRNLKRSLKNGETFELNKKAVRRSLYRPFSRKCLYFADIVIDERGKFPRFFPIESVETENQVIAVSHIGFRATAFSTLVSKMIVDQHLCATTDGHQCFPFYVYDQDGSHRSENITDWALDEFRKQYKNKKITKWDIFYYVYGLLHHPGYREKYADNLKRELPRIPFAADFGAFSKAGEKLAKLHLEYEQVKEWPLKWIDSADVPLSHRVEKMKLAKDKKSLWVNESLTLAEIPPETFEYRLGNRSALEWVIDQYQVSEDKRSGIKSDPNRADDPEYIVRLVGQVVRVSVETVKIVKGLPGEFEPDQGVSKS